MGREPKRETTKRGDKVYNFAPKQITLKGKTLDMFNYERKLRGMTETALGSEIIYHHYKNNPPKGFEPKD